MVRKSELVERVMTLQAQYHRLERVAREASNYLTDGGHTDMADRLTAVVESNIAGCSPWAFLYHPTTGQIAPEGQQWSANSRFGGYGLESRGTSWNISIASEHYWAS